MADNLTISGLGTVATDDIAGVHHQRMKLVLGADGVGVDAVGGAGVVGTAVQRVTLASDDPAVVDLAAMEVLLTGIDADTDAIKTSVEIIDDWDEADRCKVNIIAGQVGVAAGAGINGVNVQRVTIATDDATSVSLGIIDDWDEADRCKVNLIAGQAGIAAGAGAVGVTVPRITLASDDPAVTSLQVMDDWDEADRCKVNLIAGQAGVAGGAGANGATVQRITIATDDASAVAIGRIAPTARTAWPAAVANGAAVATAADKYGRQLVASVPRDLKGKQTTILNGTAAETTIISAGAAGVFQDPYAILITNESTTDVIVTIREATAGSVVDTFAVKAGQTGGFCLPSADAIPQAVAANNWTAQCSTSVNRVVILALFTSMVNA